MFLDAKNISPVTFHVPREDLVAACASLVVGGIFLGTVGRVDPIDSRRKPRDVPANNQHDEDC